MTKQYFFIALLLLSLHSNAQRRGKNYDSSVYYSREMTQMRKTVLDSLQRTEAWQTLQNRYRSYLGRSDNYSSMLLSVDISDADFSDFNSKITANGFPAMDGPAFRIVWGFSSKHNRTVFDLVFVAAGPAVKSKKGDEKIRASFTNMLMMDWGYDLVPSKRLNIYPYAGLSLRGASLTYEKPATVNPSFTDITNMIQNDQSVIADYLKPAYQAGIGFDILLQGRIARERSYYGGTMLNIKAGTNRIFGKDKYKTKGPDYIPGIRYGAWNVTIGFKFFGRE